MKKFLSIIASAFMALALFVGSGVTALAENNTVKGDVTVTAETGQTLTKVTNYNQAISDKVIKITTPEGIGDTETITYTIYKIFSASSNGSGVSYTNSNNLELPITNADTEAEATAKLALDGTNVKYYTRSTKDDTWQENTDAKATLDAAIVNKLNNLKDTKFTKIGTVAITGGNQSGYAQLADYGYYFITSTTGTVVAINTTNKNAEVSDKNEVPTIVKTEDNSTNDVGDTVTYTVTITAKKGTESLAFHDKLSSNLSLITTGDTPLSIKYKAAGDTADTTMTATGATSASAITYTQDYFSADDATEAGTGGAVTVAGDNIALRFNGTFTADTTITITYKATVGANAAINENNEAKITYGHESSYESTPVKVYESTFKFGVNKVDASSKALSGAKFALSTKDSLGDITEDNINTKTNDLIKLTSDGVVDPTTEGNNYLVAADNGSSKNGLTINGLDADASGTTYYLYEVTAPEGYNKLTGPIAVKITPIFEDDEGGSTTNTKTKVKSYTVQYKAPGDNDFKDAGTFTVGTTTDTVAFNVQNQSGTVLPSTGGIGTTIFYVAGGILIVGAAALLISRRRRA